MNNSFELVTITSNLTSFDIRCRDLSCPWYLCASVLKEGDIWIVRKFTDMHQCAIDIAKNDHRKTS